MQALQSESAERLRSISFLLGRSVIGCQGLAHNIRTSGYGLSDQAEALVYANTEWFYLADNRKFAAFRLMELGCRKKIPWTELEGYADANHLEYCPLEGVLLYRLERRSEFGSDDFVTAYMRPQLLAGRPAVLELYSKVDGSQALHGLQTEHVDTLELEPQDAVLFMLPYYS
ncbi:MAG: hypothetical protein A2808_03130 [Candidatus Moranbacteria bacterium RIFCSPHIGHO2_01_FULL_55_24]|nr:MAG: hypothetical protein A2808_03130 [Candidatus Moranbacteria bacterium RIFCSPHIGHO2_01_FULL_55_24]